MNQENIPIAKSIEPPSGPIPPAASTRALAALICGILSLVCMGFLTGIPAIILGSMELKAIKLGTAPLAGEGIAKVGYILGIVGTVLTCLAMLACVAIMALGISLGTMEAMRGTGSV